MTHISNPGFEEVISVEQKTPAKLKPSPQLTTHTSSYPSVLQVPGDKQPSEKTPAHTERQADRDSIMVVSSTLTSDNFRGAVSQEQVCAAQDYIKEHLTPVELTYQHLFAPGLYARTMLAPKGSYVVGKAHRDDHLCILLKGALTVTLDDGSTKYLEAPMMWVAQGGQKKFAYVEEDLEFVNIHATVETDLEVIEKQVIIPEDEFRNNLKLARTITKELSMNKMNQEVTL